MNSQVSQELIRKSQTWLDTRGETVKSGCKLFPKRKEKLQGKFLTQNKIVELNLRISFWDVKCFLFERTGLGFILGDDDFRLMKLCLSYQKKIVFSFVSFIQENTN